MRIKLRTCKSVWHTVSNLHVSVNIIIIIIIVKHIIFKKIILLPSQHTKISEEFFLTFLQTTCLTAPLYKQGS